MIGVTLEVLSLFEFKSIDNVGAGKRIREMLRLHTNPHTVHGRFTLKDNRERQFWNEPFRKLKESINDVVHEQLCNEYNS